jgi:GT2 family glycosyltransferase
MAADHELARGASSEAPAGAEAGHRWAVVVVNYGSHHLLERNFHFTEQLDAEVVVVDNHTTSEELAQLTELADRHGWVVVPSPTNLGFGGAVNLGAAEAFRLGCDAVVLVNPDATVTAETVTALVDAVLHEPRMLACPLIVDGSGRITFRGSEVGLRTGRRRGLAPPVVEPSGLRLGESRLDEPAFAWLTGACLAVHRRVFEELGGFDDGYFMYWEDLDFCFRASRCGVELVVRTDLRIEHDDMGTHRKPGSRAKSNLYYRYTTRNRLIFAAKHLERRDLLRWLVHTPEVSWGVLMQGGRRQLLSSPRPLLAILAGSLVGAAHAIRALAAPRRRGNP